MAEAFDILFTSALVILALMLFVCLYRAVRGPGTVDRIIAVNMISTITIMLIALSAMLIDAGYLMDIAIIYAMLGFLAVVLLCKIYIGIFRARAHREGRHEDA